MNVPTYLIFIQKTIKVPHGVLDAGSEVHEIVVVSFLYYGIHAVSLYFWHSWLNIKILCQNFAFVVNFHLRNKSTNFKTVA